MKTKDCFTELAIQIATLSMKVDKILELLNEPQEEVVINQLVTHQHFDARDPEITELVNKAVAELSDNEKFEDNYK